MTNIDLDKINNGSITDVLFYDHPDILKDSNSFFSYLFARNGIFLIQNCRFGTTFRKLPNINYSNLNLLNFYNNESGVIPNIPKANKSFLELIIEAFKYVQKHTKNEIFINLYWDLHTNKFILRIPENQIISTANAKYEYTNEEFDERFVRYLEIHSHHSMAPSFSGGSGDDKDESNKPTCFYGVIGHLNENTNIYNFSSSFRVWNGIDFTYVDPTDVFNLPKPKVTTTPKWLTSQLDDIIEKSKNKISYPQANRLYQGKNEDIIYCFGGDYNEHRDFVTNGDDITELDDEELYRLGYYDIRSNE